MKKKRFFLVIFLLFMSALSIIFLFRDYKGGKSGRREIKTIPIQKAKLVANENLNSFEPWKDPKLQESYTFYDLEGTPSAYLFNVSDNYGKAGYIVISATTKLEPVVEISDVIETPVVSALQIVNKLTQGTIYEIQDLKTQYIYLGGGGYYVKVEVREGESTQVFYYSIQNGVTKEIFDKEIQAKQDYYETHFDDNSEEKCKPFSS